MIYLKKIYAQAGKESIAAILSLFEGESGRVLLDCGCADGELTQQIKKRLKSCQEVHGIEIGEACLKKAKEKGIIIYQEDLNSGISLASESVDVVFSNQVIEHLYDTDKFISEIHRVLRPKGCAVICTENLSSWHNIFALVLGWQPFSLSNISSFGPAIGNPFSLTRNDAESPYSKGVPKFMQHSRIFTPRGLKEIFEVHCFKSEKILGAGYFPFPGIVAKLLARFDMRHSAFLIIKLRKPIN